MTGAPTQRGAIAWWCAGLVLLAAFVRLTTIASGDTPYWLTDPWLRRTPESTLTPMGSLLLDALVWLSAGMLVLRERRAGRSVGLVVPVAMLAGAFAVILHGFVLRSPEAGADGVRGHFGSFLLGSVWASGLLGAWVLSVTGRDPAVRRAAVSVILGSVVVFAIKSALNVTIEHRGLIEMFDADPGAYLAQHGLEPGSRAAAAFERRLRQPEATGWIALSNAFGSIIGAMVLGLGAAIWGVWRGSVPARRRVNLAGLGALLVLAGLALYLTRSKGAAASTALAGALLAGVIALRRVVPRRVLVVILVLGTLTPLAVVAARGMAGEALGERSLLFRWQYLGGASRIIAEHPVTGVGPDGFKSAYLQARSPDAPEEVSSPHSVMFDWLAALGVFGIAWIGVWFAWLSRGINRLTEADAEPPRDDARRADLLALGVAGATACISLWSEWAALSEPIAGAHLAGFLLWIPAARGVRRALTSVSELAISGVALAMALVIAVHAHMEVTAAITGSAPLALALLGLAGVPGRASERPGERGPSAALAGVLLAGGLGLAVYAFGPVRQWQSWLHRSAAWLGSGSDSARGPELVDRAASALPTHARTRGAGVRAALAAAASGLAPGQRVDPARLTGPGGALERAEALTEAWPGSVYAWTGLATVEGFAAASLEAGDERAREWASRAARSWERVGDLDPHGLQPALERWRLAVWLGETDAARRLAERVLEIDERRRRMDPLSGLSEAERRAVESWLAGQDAASAPVR